MPIFALIRSSAFEARFTRTPVSLFTNLISARDWCRPGLPNLTSSSNSLSPICTLRPSGPSGGRSCHGGCSGSISKSRGTNHIAIHISAESRRTTVTPMSLGLRWSTYRKQFFFKKTIVDNQVGDYLKIHGGTSLSAHPTTYHLRLHYTYIVELAITAPLHAE